MHTQNASGFFSGIGKNAVARSQGIKQVFLLSDIQRTFVGMQRNVIKHSTPKTFFMSNVQCTFLHVTLVFKYICLFAVL